MNMMEGYQTEPSMLSYRNADGEALWEIAQPVPRLPIEISSLFSSPSPSWYIPTETDTSLATSTVGPNLGQLAHESAAYDYAGHGHANQNQRWTLPGYPSRYEPYALCDSQAISLPSSPFHPVKALDSTFYDPFPRVVGYGEIYTDDARMRPGDGIRRHCFNCRVAETTTWRRSTLNFGKLLCNKCGLFERTHGVPRPKSFPRRRRNRSRRGSPASDESVTSAPLNSDGHNNLTDSNPYASSYASQFLDIFNAIDGTTTLQPQNMPWMTHDIRHVSPTPSSLSSSPSTTPEIPMAYHLDFELPSALPTTGAYTTPSWEFLSTHLN